MLTLQSGVDQQHMFDFFFTNSIYGQKALPTPATLYTTRQDNTAKENLQEANMIHISIKDGTRQLFLII